MNIFFFIRFLTTIKQLTRLFLLNQPISLVSHLTTMSFCGFSFHLDRIPEEAAIKCCRACFSIKFCACDSTPFFLFLILGLRHCDLKKTDKMSSRQKLSSSINVSFKAPAWRSR